MKIDEDILLISQIIIIPFMFYLCFSFLENPYNMIAYCIISVAIFYFSNKLKKN